MTIEQKLAYIKAFHMGMADCSSCPLRLGTTCPAKPWHEWTDSEIMLAYEILRRRGEEIIKLKEAIKPDNDKINPDNGEIETADDEVEFVKAADSVEHPAHYTQNGIECIEAIKASMTADGFIGYCKGNVLKYIWRWRDKGGVQDLEKAKVYLGWMIEEAAKCTES